MHLNRHNVELVNYERMTDFVDKWCIVNNEVSLWLISDLQQEQSNCAAKGGLS